MVDKLNVLMLHDIEYENEHGTVRWAYANRTHGLAKVAPSWCNVTRMGIPEAAEARMSGENPLDGIDVVLNMDYQSTAHVRNAVMGHSKIPLVSSFNKDRSANSEYWDPCHSVSDYVICNNADRFNWALENGYDRCCYISNGVDTEQWVSALPVDSRHFDVGWCGAVAPKKGKGYHDIIAPLSQELHRRGTVHSFRPIVSAQERSVFATSTQMAWYNRCKIFLCVSKSEGGGPSSLMEAMACGCIPVTVKIGGVSEFCKHGENSCIIRRSVEDALSGITQVLEDMDRQGLSDAAEKAMQPYAYGSQRGPDKWFYRLLKRIAERVEVKPFNYLERDWDTL